MVAMPKIYSEDFRLQVVKCVKRGKSYEKICEFFNINFEHMCMIAEKFVKNAEYNSISFAPGKVIFLIAFHQNFSR